MKINIFLYSLFLLVITTCHNTNMEKEKFYVYGTPEFKEEEGNFKISLEEASQIYAKYIFDSDKEKKILICKLDIIYNDYYLFSPFLYNAKTGEYNLSGIWVNGYTGEIKKVNTKNQIHIILKVPRNYYRKSFKRETI